jgi:hypothetical protein
MRLATDGDVETWLDLTTGRQLVGRARRAEPSPPAAREPVMSETPLIDVAIAALDANGWSYQRDDAGAAVVFPIRGARSAYEGTIVTTEEARFLTTYCVFAPRVPETRRPAMLEAIARANFGLHTGAFEVDLDDGELRFRDGLIARRAELPLGFMRDMLSFSVFICDRYHDALMGVAFGDVEPAAAIAAVEGE